ncbi:hypothetical protein TKK_0017036 [Trichogramma kaykai]
MHQAARYFENRPPLHTHIYASARESEVHYGLRHLSHSIVAVSLLHEAMRYARSDGSKEFETFRQRVADCFAYTPLQYGQGLTVSPPYSQFCDLLDQALPFARKMEESIEETSKNVNSRGFVDINLKPSNNMDEDCDLDESDKSNVSTSNRASFTNPKSKEFIEIEESDEDDDDVASTKSDRSTISNSPINQTQNNSNGKESTENKPPKQWLRIVENVEDEEEEKEGGKDRINTPPSSQTSQVGNITISVAPSGSMQPKVAIQRIDTAAIIKAKNESAPVAEVTLSDDDDDNDYIEPSQIKKVKKLSVATQNDSREDDMNSNGRGGQLEQWLDSNALNFDVKLFHSDAPTLYKVASFIDSALIKTDTRTRHNFLNTLDAESDHEPLETDLILETDIEADHSNVGRYLYKKTNVKKFDKYLNEHTIEIPHNRYLSNEETDTYIDELQATINSAIQCSTPVYKQYDRFANLQSKIIGKLYKEKHVIQSKLYRLHHKTDTLSKLAYNALKIDMKSIKKKTYSRIQ